MPRLGCPEIQTELTNKVESLTQAVSKNVVGEATLLPRTLRNYELIRIHADCGDLLVFWPSGHSENSRGQKYQNGPWCHLKSTLRTTFFFHKVIKCKVQSD